MGKIGQKIGQRRQRQRIDEDTRSASLQVVRSLQHQLSRSAKSVANNVESPTQIEPARIDVPTGDVLDLVAEISAKAEVLGRALHPQTALHLASLVRLMNTYYSNLIEGHHPRPRDIERALAGELSEHQRDLMVEAVAHYRVQERIDRAALHGELRDPADVSFILQLHRDFYAGASVDMLTVRGEDERYLMKPGEWRSRDEHDVQIGRHLPPSSSRVADFMAYFYSRFAFEPSDGVRMAAVGAGRAKRILAMATAHHRFNWIHPFPDGNGRVSRLMSHAMAQKAGIGARGLWSVSRGLARGLEQGDAGRAEYRKYMAWADAPRQGERDGRGNLSEKHLVGFVEWFLKVCLDQIDYMSGLFDLDTLSKRLEHHVSITDGLSPEGNRLLQEALVRGEFERGAAPRLTGLPERSARRVLKELTEAGLLASDTPKGPVSLRFPTNTQDTLFPRLFAY